MMDDHVSEYNLSREKTWFGDITEREKSEVQIMAECYTNTAVNIATALGFFSAITGDAGV